MSENILEVKDLVVHFETDDGCVKAVNGMNFAIGKKKTLGLVADTSDRPYKGCRANADRPARSSELYRSQILRTNHLILCCKDVMDPTDV